jgi:hypothetical protein
MQYWEGAKSLCTCTLLEVRTSHAWHILRGIREKSRARGVNSKSYSIGMYCTFTVNVTLTYIREVHMEFFPHTVVTIATYRQSTTYIICNELRERDYIYVCTVKPWDLFFLRLFNPIPGHGLPLQGFIITLRHAKLARTPLKEQFIPS